MMDFTDEQEALIQAAVNWYHFSSEQIFQFAGGPGTGKSVVLNEIIRRINIPPERIATMAYTGAAAIVMRIKGLAHSKTIHSTMYEMVSKPLLDEYGRIVMDPYFNTPVETITFVPRDLSNIDLFAIDEAGTVPMHMRNDILSQGKKVLVCGDLDQLPPVGDDPAFLYNGKVHHLTKIMRQAGGSAIVYLSQRAKQGLPIHTGFYGDVYVITEDDVTDQMIINSQVILCGKNSTRENINQMMRYKLGFGNSKFPCMGEKLICRKNNWGLEVAGINLTNGLSGVVTNSPDVSEFDGKTFRIDFFPTLSAEPFTNILVNYKYFISDIEQRRKIKSSKMAFRYPGNLFEYGYSQTVHLAQGSQWTSGMYFEEYLHPDMNARLNYTALTRFSQSCIYVKRKRKFY